MRPRLLLLEDDATSRAFLVAASESLPADVDAADSSASALALAVQHEYALWMLDANLPDGTGAGLLATLRALGLRTPALAHTAAHDPAELDALVSAGFDAAIAKPITTDAWTAALQRALAGRANVPAYGNVATAPPAAADTATWDDAAALAALNGNRAHVDALRQLFLVELPGARDAIMAACAAGDADALSASLHKLRAGCGFVGAKRLEAATIALQGAPRSPAAMQALLAATQDLLSS